MPPTDKQLATLDSFHRWVKSLFGKSKPCFSCRHHVRQDGLVEINRGEMVLSMRDNGTFAIYDIAGGMRLVVCEGAEKLEEALMAAFSWAIRRKFHDTYQP